MMNGRKRVWRRVAAALVVAVAAGIVWGVVLFWAGYIVAQFGRKDQIQESIEILRDGTPVIESRSVTNWIDVSYRTFDGRPVEVDPERTLPGANLSPPIEPPGLYEPEIPWQSRIAGMSDFQRRPTAWYVVRDGETMGKAYLVGYDFMSKLLVGYIGRGGFSRALPPRDQWFDLGRHKLAWGGAIASLGQINFGSMGYSYYGGYSVASDSRRIPPWNAYMIDDGQLAEINLRDRTIRSIHESPDLIAVAILYEVVGKPKEDAKEPAKDAAASAGSSASSAEAVVAPLPSGGGVGEFRAILPAPTANVFSVGPLPPAPAETGEKQELQARVALRTADKVVIIDPIGGSKREFKLPEKLRNVMLSTYPLAGGQLLLVWYPENNRQRQPVELTWIEADGSVAREQEVALARTHTNDERVAAWMAVPVAPTPVGWSAVLGIVGPVTMVQDHKAPTYVDALTQVLSFAGMPFVAVVLISALLAWLTLRLQRKYRRPASGIWAGFVFLLGLPGFLAYLIEHRRAKLEACPQCGEIVPRDRDSCAACNAEFPAPAPVGTEIFA